MYFDYVYGSMVYLCGLSRFVFCGLLGCYLFHDLSLLGEGGLDLYYGGHSYCEFWRGCDVGWDYIVY